MSKKKPYFSKKGNTEDFNYLNHQIIFTIGAVLFFGLIIILVKCGWL